MTTGDKAAQFLKFTATSDSLDGKYIDGIEPRIPGTFKPENSWAVLSLSGVNKGQIRAVSDQAPDGRLKLTLGFDYPIRKGDVFWLQAPGAKLELPPPSACVYLTKAQLADEFEKLRAIIRRAYDAHLEYPNDDEVEIVIRALQERATQLRIEAKGDK